MTMTLETIRAAHARIAPYIVQTPLLRLPALDDALGCEVYVKAECMQRTGAFKLRGAMNRILALTEDERARGFVAAASGNHGRAVAYAAQRFGTHACIVMPRTAPAVKQAGIRALGAELVLCDAAERFDVAARLCAERGAAMVPPFNDELVMAGQGTVGLEILEQCPELDAVVVPVSGGGLIGGVSTAVKALAPRVRVFGAEPAVLPRYTESLRAGHPVQVPVYDYTIHNRSNQPVLVQPAPVIIVEGILIFDSPELCELMDMKVFVDTDADVRILRRIVRDVKERGRTLDSVVSQYLTTVKPMHEQFVEPSKRKADLIVPEGGRNLVALELLIKWVDNHLHNAE